MTIKRKTNKSSVNKKVRNATPKVYDGISFRSQLEVNTYQQLKKFKIEAEYEPIQFTLIDAFRYNDESIRKMTYTPDFVGNRFIIECKGFANESFPLKWKIFKHFLYMNKLEFTLYLPKNRKEVDEVIKSIISSRNGN